MRKPIRAPHENAALHLAAFSFWAATSVPLGAVLLLGTMGAHAAETPPATSAVTATPSVPIKAFVTIGEKPAVLFDSPSTRGVKTFIIQRGTPLEALVKLGQWTKIRDAEGSIGWVENSALSERRHVAVSGNFAEVRVASTPSSALVFEAQRAVLLEVTGPMVDGWLPVRHRDGQSGFVKATQVWGD